MPVTRTVLVVVHEDTLGGATRAVLRIAPLIEREGFAFAFWAPDPSEAATELREMGYPVSGAPRYLKYRLASLRWPPGIRKRLASVPGYLRALRREVRSSRPALVHANTLLTLPEAVTARSAGVPVLVHAHEALPKGIYGAVGRLLLTMSAREVVAPSRATAATLEGGRLHPRVAYNGIALPDAPADRPSSGDLVIGMVAEVAPRKGVDFYVDAVAHLRERLPGAHFKLVGRPPDNADAPWGRAVIERGEAAGIEWIPRTDVIAELPSWDIFVLPSRRDPFPLAVLEAMACGLPVVASAVDGIVEQLAGDAGVLVPPGDVDALASAIVELGEQPELRARLGAAARSRVESEFTLERQAEAMLDAYRAALLESDPFE